jgi:hypothetical protein
MATVVHTVTPVSPQSQLTGASLRKKDSQPHPGVSVHQPNSTPENENGERQRRSAPLPRRKHQEISYCRANVTFGVER